MIELPDLFHETRIAELSFALIIYAPIGLCLLLIRSIVICFLLLIAYFLPRNASFNLFLNEIICVLFQLTITDETIGENKSSRQKTRVILANRCSLFDGWILKRFISNPNCQSVKPEGDNCLKLNTIENQEDLCLNEIQKSNAQLIFLPECESTTGTDGLLKFNLLSLAIAQKLQLPIQPVSLRTLRAFQIRTTTFNSHPFVDLFWFLFSPYTHYNVKFLPIVSPSELTTAESLAEQVRESISQSLNIELTQFDERDVAELKKRPDLLQRRHAQRRAEFQQMIHLVHQQVPLASLEAIRYDLETTKNVQKTIANLNERAAAAARAAATPKSTSSSANNSGAINKSSGSNGHRQTYERLKQELIEKNRQLFLNKNCN